MELNLNGKFNLDRDMIMLEILAEQILKELNVVLESVEKYKQGITYLVDYNQKKEMIWRQMLSNDWDEDQNAKIVRII